MGELQTEPFQFTFNGFLKVAFQGSRITSDAGLILVRELDERLGLEALIAAHLSDSRQGANTQFSVADLLRQSVYSRLAGYEDLNDGRWCMNRNWPATILTQRLLTYRYRTTLARQGPSSDLGCCMRAAPRPFALLACALEGQCR